MPGFNLPPGCSVSDIPGNRPEELAAEALCEDIADIMMNAGCPDDERLTTAVDEIFKMIGAAYASGMADGKCEEAMANEFRNANKEDKA